MHDPSELVLLRGAIKKAWGSTPPDKKAAGYIGAFFNAERRGSKLIALT